MADQTQVYHAREAEGPGLPRWGACLIRRLAKLEEGRYMLTFSRSGDKVDWTVMPLGKVEQTHS